MEFCPKCGAILILTEKGEGVCAGCGYKSKKKQKIKVSEKIIKKEIIAVIDEKGERTDPVTEIICPKCKNKKAYFWTRQTRSSDESETKFYECIKCHNTWRIYK